MPKTVKRSSTKSRKAAGSEDLKPQRIDAALVRKIQNLTDIITKLEVAGGNLPGEEEDRDEGERIKNKALDQLWQEFARLEKVVYASEVQPGDEDAIKARLAILKFRVGEELGDYKELHFGVEHATGKLIEGMLSFYRAN